MLLWADNDRGEAVDAGVDDLLQIRGVELDIHARAFAVEVDGVHVNTTNLVARIS